MNGAAVASSAARSAIPGLFAAAKANRGAGRLEEAKKLCLQVLAIDVRHAESLNLLGLIAHQAGGDQVALKMIHRAIAVNSQEAAYHTNLALVLEEMGNHGEAVAAAERAVALKPEMPEAWVNLARSLYGQGKFERAAECLQKALAINPNYHQAHNNLGSVYLGQGRLDEARACFERALTFDPDYLEGLTNLGAVLIDQGELDRARACLEHAVTLNPGYAAAHNNLGHVLSKQNHLEEARCSFERAIALEQNHGYHYNLGMIQDELGDLKAAMSSYGRALAIKPDFPPAYRGLGRVCRQEGRLDRAEFFYRQALNLNPGYRDARLALGMAQLLKGEYDSGWRNFESRWGAQGHDTKPRLYAQPQWTGERLGSGDVFLWGEQGIGDEIMFAGLIPDAVKTGNHVVLECEARLQPLFARSFPGVEVISAKERQFMQLNRGRIAAHLPTGSLPRLFRPSGESFASTTSPYLQADGAQRESFRSKYSDGRKRIGLAWKTKAKVGGRLRSLDLSLLGPLFALPDVRWISLQYGNFDVLEQEAAAAGAPLLIDRGVDQLTDMDSFASQIAALDMVITIDNATVHLAGSLGVPTWVLLPFAPDWRWQLERTDCPWYPGVRLFRQSETRAWGPVIEQVRDAFSTCAMP